MKSINRLITYLTWMYIKNEQKGAEEIQQRFCVSMISDTKCKKKWFLIITANCSEDVWDDISQCHPKWAVGQFLSSVTLRLQNDSNKTHKKIPPSHFKLLLPNTTNVCQSGILVSPHLPRLWEQWGGDMSHTQRRGKMGHIVWRDSRESRSAS